MRVTLFGVRGPGAEAQVHRAAARAAATSGSGVASVIWDPTAGAMDVRFVGAVEAVEHASADLVAWWERVRTRARIAAEP
ncbi:MAG: hypothetical protein ACOZNI_00885 [Myxococcota bacterium]